MNPQNCHAVGVVLLFVVVGLYELKQAKRVTTARKIEQSIKTQKA